MDNTQIQIEYYIPDHKKGEYADEPQNYIYRKMNMSGKAYQEEFQGWFIYHPDTDGEYHITEIYDLEELKRWMFLYKMRCPEISSVQVWFRKDIPTRKTMRHLTDKEYAEMQKSWDKNTWIEMSPYFLVLSKSLHQQEISQQNNDGTDILSAMRSHRARSALQRQSKTVKNP